MVGGKIFDEDIYIFMWLLSAEDIPVTIFLKSFTSKNINIHIHALNRCTKKKIIRKKKNEIQGLEITNFLLKRIEFQHKLKMKTNTISTSTPNNPYLPLPFKRGPDVLVKIRLYWFSWEEELCNTIKKKKETVKL